MNEDWWEKPTCFICDYWWLLLLLLALILTAFFTRDLWMDLLGIQPPETSTRTGGLPVLGTGDVQVTLFWDTSDDLDLWVIDPEDNRIFYDDKKSPSGGELDVDANAACSENFTLSPVENIYWPTGGAPFGSYTVKINYYENCESTQPIPYTVLVKVDGVEQVFSGEVVNVGEVQTITTFER